jgi:hypothetical protein
VFALQVEFARLEKFKKKRDVFNNSEEPLKVQKRRLPPMKRTKFKLNNVGLQVSHHINSKVL